jgi:cytoskeleton protein RodZ
MIFNGRLDGSAHSAEGLDDRRQQGMSQRFSRQPHEMNNASRQLMTSLGAALRDARQNRGENLYDVANYLRIKPSYLFALEEGDISLTPGRAYALGFIRTYSEYLGFDSNDVLRQVKLALDQTDPAPPLRYRTPIGGETVRPSGFLLGLSIVMIGLIYGTWHIYFRGEPIMDRVTAVPGELGRMTAGLLNPASTPPAAQPAAPPPTEMQTDEEVRLSSAATPSASPTNQAAPIASVPSAAAPPAPADATATANPNGPAADGATAPSEDTTAATASPPPAPQQVTTNDLLQALRSPANREVAQAPVAPSLPDHTPAIDPMAAAAADAPRVILVARENSWIQVRSTDRDFVRTTTLTPGEKMELPNRADLALWTGNAGGLEIVVDGQSIGTLGQSGRVMRDVSLAPDQLKARMVSALH